MKIEVTLPETTASTPLKVHSDATKNYSTEMSSAGWLFSSHNGKPLDAKGCKLGKGYNITDAEIEAIKRVVKAVNSYNQVQHLKIYADCENAVNILDRGDLKANNYEYVTIEWIPREENFIADIIADNMMRK